MHISVIIPVYNAELYLRKAVESALIQVEVGEIILVEDNSPDNALAVCNRLVEEHSIVKLFQHPDKKNHGAGASRNLGMQMAKCDFVAFLDADDYYLPNRFEYEKKILFNDTGGIDGLYGALGFHYYSKQQKQRYIKDGFEDLTTVNCEIDPVQLFETLLGLNGNCGHIHLDALTVRKTVFDRVGYFDVNLRLHQDTEWILRLSAHCKLYGGSISKAVGMRGVHDENRIVSKKTEPNRNRLLLWSTVFHWCTKDKFSMKIFLKVKEYYSIENAKHSSWFFNLMSLIAFPFIGISYKSFLFELLVLKVFGNTLMKKMILCIRNLLYK